MRQIKRIALLAAASSALWALPSPPAVEAAEVALSVAGEEDLRGDIENASLLLRAEGDEDVDITNPQDLVAAAQADYTRIVGRLYSEGYYGPVVSILIDGREAAEIPPLDAPANVERVEIRVETGLRFVFGRAAIGPLAPGTELPEGFAAGETAETAVIRRAAAAAVTGWRQVGRAKAEVAEQEIVARHLEEVLNVAIAIRPGPVVRFGRLNISGNEDVRTERIRRIAGFPTDAVFDPDDLELAQRRLRRTGAFSAVVLEEAETLGPGDTLDVDLTVIEAPPRRFGFGAEIASSEGLSLEAFWMHRNLLGGAERLRFEGEVSGIGGNTGEDPDYRLSARFDRPATFDADTDLSLLAEVERLDEPNFDSEIVTLQASAVRYATDDLIVRAGVGLRASNVEDDLGKRQFRHLLFPLAAELDRRDDRYDATEGYYVDLTVDPYLALGGDSATGGRLYADTRTYRGFGESDRFVLAGRVQVGSVIGSSIEETPPDYLFFSGGGGTVRGQPYESLGIDIDGDDDDDIVGGRSFLGLSGELRAGVTERIGVVGFVDAGHVGESSFGGDGDSHVGAGLGVRYDTGIGPIRLDLAAPVSGGTGEGIQIYLGIGQAF